MRTTRMRCLPVASGMSSCVPWRRWIFSQIAEVDGPAARCAGRLCHGIARGRTSAADILPCPVRRRARKALVSQAWSVRVDLFPPVAQPHRLRRQADDAREEGLEIALLDVGD